VKASPSGGPGFWATAVVATLLAGVVPVAILAGLEGTLLLSAEHEYPLVVSLSVVVGDLLVLPILNGLALPILCRDAAALIRRRRSAFVGAVVAALVASGLVNAATHYAWIHDEYTGYMDAQLGRLSPAGWWHLAFSVAQMALILLLVMVWIVQGRSNESHRPQYLRAWVLLVVFTSLGVLGAVLAKLFILPEVSLTPARILVPLVPCAAAVALLLYALRAAPLQGSNQDEPRQAGTDHKQRS
jgi:hypothetical protein